MYNKGFISATDGNISIKVSENRILFTPSGKCKGFLEFDDLIITDLDGKKLTGSSQPSSELYMHLNTYKNRNDISAIVHAHPPITVALSFANIDLKCILPEVILSIGEKIPTVPYKATGTMKLAESIIPFIKDYDAIILEKHGTLTLGKDIFSAYYKLEKIESMANVFYIAKQLGNINYLNSQEIEELIKIRESKIN